MQVSRRFVRHGHLTIRQELGLAAAEHAEAQRRKIKSRIDHIRSLHARCNDPKELVFLETKLASLRRAYLRG